MRLNTLFHNMIELLALNKPSPYLCLVCFALMWIFVGLGNPLLPIASLERYGWAWHHIPESLGFFFFGMWFADLALRQSKQTGWIDIPYVMTLVIMSLIEAVYFTLLVVIPIVTLPSFTGYFLKRTHISETRNSPSLSSQ